MCFGSFVKFVSIQFQTEIFTLYRGMWHQLKFDQLPKMLNSPHYLQLGDWTIRIVQRYESTNSNKNAFLYLGKKPDRPSSVPVKVVIVTLFLINW